jgi:MoaA/NifB/PqqE/SkfB family radical SAM enzyme
MKLPEANVMFGGGEPTFHPNFEQIVLEKPEHITISLLSNASRPIAFWERIVDKLDIVLSTFHAEFADPDRFLKTMELIYLQSRRRGKIHLAIPPHHWDLCTSMYEQLKERKIEVTLKPILTSIMDLSNPGEPDQRMIDEYTDEQIEWMKERDGNKGFQPIGIYNKHGRLISKTKQSELIATKQNSFVGWQCHAPKEYLYINWDGEVYDTACRQRHRLGNIYKDFEILKNETIMCEQKFCWCFGDIKTTKIKDLSVTYEQTLKKNESRF